MTDERTRHAHELLKRALDLEPARRSAFLDEMCDDAAVRAEVDSLLAALDEAGTFLEEPVLSSGDDVGADEQAQRMVGRQVGRYRIRSVIASGGMANVYEAHQDQPRRKVALKVMKPGVTSRSATRRFEFESQILARLRHAGIAQVYETGTYDDGTNVLPYFAMEYVPGHKAITEYAEDRGLGTRDRVRLFTRVCDAVSHGHQKGIIHRDLKPSNILVSAAGELKIIDFGIARATDSDMAVTTLQTDVGQLIGTLQYMSPEQCEADPEAIDVRSDVYSLGMVLYELICAQLPYDVKTMSVYDAARAVRETPPRRPSTVNRALRGDLETIVLKALEKSPERRYRSAASLGDDLHRYLQDEPISARPPSAVYQLRKFAKRHKAMVTAVTAIVVLLVAGVIAERRQRMVAEEAREQAVVARDESEAVTRFFTDMLAEANPGALGKDATLREVLDSSARAVPEQFADRPHLEARVRNVAAETYIALGLYEEAEPHLEAAIELRRRALGDEHEETFRSMSNLAVVYLNQARYDDADRIIGETLERQRAALGEHHEAVFVSVNNLAEVRVRQGRMDEGEALHLENLENRRAHLGRDHTDTLTTQNNLAMLYSRLGRFEEAEPLLIETLELRRGTLGEEHPDTLVSMNNLAYMYNEQGKYDEATPLLQRTVELNRRVFGDRHSTTLTSINNLAVAHYVRQEYDAAEPLFLESLEINRATLGETHPNSLLAMTNLAGLYARQERPEVALATYEEALALMRTQFPAGHFQIGMALQGYGRSLLELERFGPAEEALLEAHGILETNLGPEHRRTITTVRRLVQIYEATGNTDQVAYWQAKLPPQDPNP